MSSELDNAILRNLLAQTTRAYEEQMAALFAEKELAQVSLASIGDGVLTTDGAGRLEYLNPVAEAMTGWSLAEARGRPLAEVFRVLDEESDRPLPPPSARCLAAGERVRSEGRITLERRDGQRHAIESTCAPIRDRGGAVIGTVTVFQDVSEKRLMELQLAHQASHDALTGLFNRQAFEVHLQRALDECRQPGVSHVFCYMDLDQFKVVNDTCGHLAGDELLQQVTALLQEGVRDSDLVARLGGDEFGLLLTGCTAEAGERRAGELHRALGRMRFVWREKTFTVGASIGLVPIVPELKTLANLLSAADHACYLAKDRGRDRIQVYRQDDVELVRRHGEMGWVVRIQETLDHDRFQLYCQDILPLADGADGAGGSDRGAHFEVLLRMVEEDGRIHLPSDFIRAAERYGLMRSIDRWVIRTCLETLMGWPAELRDDLATCSINLSAVSLGDEGFLDWVRSELARLGAPARKICFEITETAAIENLAEAGHLIGELAAMGVRFALDDFGTGMSSYGYLKDLPVSFLKIDGSFIKDIVTDPLDRAMVESINQVGHVMGIATVAEAVGSGVVVNRLRALGVDYAQGNWIAPPRPMSELCLARSA